MQEPPQLDVPIQLTGIDTDSKIKDLHWEEEEVVLGLEKL
jgi:hypothetical protein